jgi:riboflavin biosynthesis pyrimidine reductase
MRALADAVLVGAHTVRADNPQLTVRRCAGRNPIRIIIDPDLSLSDRHSVFCDGAALTVVVAAQEHANGRGEVHGSEVLGVPRVGRTLDVAAIRSALGERGVRSCSSRRGITTLPSRGGVSTGCDNNRPIIIGIGRPVSPGGPPARLRASRGSAVSPVRHAVRL